MLAIYRYRKKWRGIRRALGVGELSNDPRADLLIQTLLIQINLNCGGIAIFQ